MKGISVLKATPLNSKYIAKKSDLPFNYDENRGTESIGCTKEKCISLSILRKKYIDTVKNLGI